MTHQQMTAIIRDYIVENFLYMHADVTLADDAPLIGSGVLDSMGVVELIAFVEDEFGVRVEDTDVTEANFGSVSVIARLVEVKRTSQAAA